jgi:hypothetical protein
MGEWAAKVSEAVASRKDAVLAVYRESVQRTIEMAQSPVAGGGNMPIKTGFLRASGQVVIGTEPPSIQATPGDGKSVSYDGGAVSLVISNANLDDTITFAYTAAYARRQNYGFVGADSLGRVYNQKGYHFVDLAAQAWPQTVDQVSREAEAKIRG